MSQQTPEQQASAAAIAAGSTAEMAAAFFKSLVYQNVPENVAAHLTESYITALVTRAGLRMDAQKSNGQK